MRLSERSLKREEILQAIESYEIIESYPDDKYLPSDLVSGKANEKNLHILFAVDYPGDNVRVVTAYLPDASDWSPDFRMRKK